MKIRNLLNAGILRIFIGALMLLGSVGVSGQNYGGCYEVKKSYSGYKTTLFPSEMYDTICSLVSIVDEIDSNSYTFKVLSFDLYPIIGDLDPIKGIEYQKNEIVNEVNESYSEYIIVFHIFIEGNMDYSIVLKLPRTGKLKSINDLEESTIANRVEVTMGNTANYFDNATAEIQGFYEFWMQLNSIKDGSFNPNLFKENGFEEISYIDIDLLTRNDIFIEDSNNGKIRVVNSGGYFFDNINISEEIANSETPYQGIDYLFVISGLDNIDSINVIKQKYDNSKAKIKIWIHFDFEVPYNDNVSSRPPPPIKNRDGNGYSVYIKTDNNLTNEEADKILSQGYEEKIAKWQQNEIKVDDNGDPTNVDCGLSWQYGKNCIIPNVSTFVDGNSAIFGSGAVGKLNGAMIAGFLDGLLGTIQFFYENSRGLWEKLKDNADFVGALLNPYGGGMIYLFTKAVPLIEALTKDLEKTMNKAKEWLKDEWDSIKNSYTTIMTAFHDLNWDKIKATGIGVMEGINEWVGKEFVGSYSAAVGYHVGLIAFDISSTYFTAGALNAVKGTKMGMKFIDLLEKLGNRTGISELVQDMLNLGDKAKALLCKTLKLGCFVEDTPVLMVNNSFMMSGKAMAMAAALPIISLPIQDVQLLDYAVVNKTVNAGYGQTACNSDTYMGLFDKDPYTSDQQRERDQYKLNDRDWNEVVFEEVDGTLTMKLALHSDWIKKQDYSINAIVDMHLPEQGIEGAFRITTIKHILPQKKPVDEDPDDDYDYKPVTGLITHQSGTVFDITFAEDKGEVEGKMETIGVTAVHPFYSLTAGDWVAAGDLKVGEKVLAKSGAAIVVSSRKREGIQTVYNLEVKDWHNFLVGNEGVVVHNSCWKIAADYASGKLPKSDIWKLKGYPRIFKRGNIIEKVMRKSKYKNFNYTGKGLNGDGLGISNYWLIDFFKGNKVVSLKSTKHVDGSVWATQNAKHIRDLNTRKKIGRFPNCKDCTNPSHVIENITKVELHIVVEDISLINKSDWITQIKSKLPPPDIDNLIITISEM